MKLLLWNVNGLRAISKKEVSPGITFDGFIKGYDIVILNETKICDGKLKANDKLLANHNYAYHAHSTVKLGYSGVSILTNIKPIKRIYPSMNNDEGRLVILEFDSFILIGVYVPNSGPVSKETKRPKRLDYRAKTWDVQFRKLCYELEQTKPIIVAGDLNVAYTDMDVYNPSKLGNTAGFTPEERENFGRLLESTSLIDTWRRKHPSKTEFSFFDYRSRARERNAGWRIDYMLLSKDLYSKVKSCTILSDITGSDHLPVKLHI